MKFSVSILFLILLSAQKYSSYGQESEGFIYHIVKSNENVYQISTRYNCPVDSIKSWNYLDQNLKILPGMKLMIRQRSIIVPIQLPTKNKLTSETGLVAINDTSDSRKSIQRPDSLIAVSGNNYLPLLSNSFETDTVSSFSEIILHFYNSANSLIKIILFLNLFFLASVASLLIVILNRRLRDGYIDFKKSKCLDRYRDFITDWLYEEHLPSVPESVLQELKDSVNRDVFTSELLSLHANLTGDSADKLVELFHLAGLKKYSIRKASHSSWNMKAKGFRELAQMKIEEESNLISKYLHSENDVLRIEAQMAWIQLNPKDPLSFCDDPEVNLTEWGLLNSLVALKKIDAVPDFRRWLPSLNKSVALFALKMSGVFKQFDNIDLVTLRLDDIDLDIRHEAICALGKMAVPSPGYRLRQLFLTEESENRTEILRSLIMMSDCSNVPFFEEVLLNETEISIRILAAKGLVSFDSVGEEWVNSLFEVADPVLKTIIIHAKDERI
ncbi:MAG TPA: LysM peptidoglycan-binding domain-containing protein [Prolixibacteraceae bacterium]|nr:LysM peptidoglycan-binding domain-containing protein [Prolixibacteraceae bacterium]